MKLSDKLKSIRIENKLTLDETVEKLNKFLDSPLNKGTISNWENGKREPKNTYIAAYAKAFNVDFNYLIGLYNSDATMYVTSENPNEVKKDHSVDDLPEFFETAEEARDFVFNKTRVFGFNGLDVTKLSDDELLMYANSILNTVKMLSRRLNK